MKFGDKNRRLQPMVSLCLWTVCICLVSNLSCKIMDGEREDKRIREEIRKTETYISMPEEETVPFQGNNLQAYIELVRMPAETVFENIRVMLVNKKNNSIFYDIKDFQQIKEEIAAEGYRGKILYQQAKNRVHEFVVINELPLEEYLYGVVPSEMPSGYPIEALKAQAICARTYAVIHMMNPGYPDYNAHVNDTTAFQVYHNIEEQQSTNQAVDETRGCLLFQKNGEALAETYYYSTSCGLTCEATTNGEFKEYIQTINGNHFEVNESWYRWEYEASNIDKSELLERMQDRYKVQPNNILTLTGNGTYESRPLKELKTIRELFVSKRGDGGVAEELMIHTAQNIYKVVGEYNIRYVLNDDSFQVVRQDGSKLTMPTLLPSAFIDLEATKKRNTVSGYQILGGGYGHGVGMSQNGAKGMAEQGYSSEQILAYFFPGCIIRENLWK